MEAEPESISVTFFPARVSVITTTLMTTHLGLQAPFDGSHLPQAPEQL